MNLEPNEIPKDVQSILDNVIKPIQNDCAMVSQAVDRAAAVLQYGTFSERNPELGKMRTCVHCHRRKREGDPLPCCSTRLTRSAIDLTLSPVQPTQNQVLGAAMFQRKRRNPHYSAKRNLIHQYARAFAESEALMKQAQREMLGLPGRRTPEYTLGMMNAAPLAEKYVLFLRDTERTGCFSGYEIRPWTLDPAAERAAREEWEMKHGFVN